MDSLKVLQPNPKYPIPYTKYSVFCTGSSGLVASHFKKTAQRKEIPFVGLDLHGESESVNILDKAALLSYIQARLSSFSRGTGAQQQRGFHRMGIEKPILFHFAAFTATGKNITPEQAELCKKLNVGGTQTVLKVCKELHIPMVLISTDFVFAGCDKTTPYLTTDEPCADDTVYVQTKVEAEALVKKASEEQTTVVIRLAFPYGNPDHPKPDLVKKMLGWMKENHSVGFYTDQHTCPTSLTYFSDCCLKTAELLAQDKLESGTILHGVGEPTTPYAFAQIIKRIFGVKTTIHKKELDGKGPKNLVLETKSTHVRLKLKSPTHFEALTSLKNEYES